MRVIVFAETMTIDMILRRTTVDDLVGQVDKNDKNDQVEDLHLMNWPTSSPRPPVLASLLFINCQIVEEIKSGNDKDFQ